MIKTLLSTVTVAVLAGVYAAPSQASSTLFESRDILTPSQAQGRFQWLEKCYKGLLLEVSDRMFDPTVPQSNEQKLQQLKSVLLYKDGALRSDAKYLTFGNAANENPKNWFAGTGTADNCVQVPSDYGISALMISPSTAQYCPTQSRDKDYEYIKAVKIGNLNNDSNAQFYSNFVGQVAKVYRDTPVAVTLTPGFTTAEVFPESWHVFVDWNQDGDFSDASETHFVGVSQTAITFNLTPPAGTVTGLTKMRVTMDYFGGNTNACAQVGSGEIEDYLIYIK